MQRVKLSFVLFISLFSFVLVAAPDTNTVGNASAEKDAVEITVVPEHISRPSPEALRALMEEAHEAFESEDEEASYVRRWVEKFNYNQALLRAHRWYLQKSGTLGTSEHVGNIAIMLLFSHSLETLGGTSLASWATSGDLHLAWKILLSTVGIGVTVPGLDPLCIGLGLSYAKWPVQMNYGLQVPRIVIVKTTGFAAKVLGIRWAMRSLFSQQPAASFLATKLPSQSGPFSWNVDPDNLGYVLHTRSRTPLATLKMQAAERGSLFVETISIAHGDDLQRSANQGELKAAVKPLGWNARNAVFEALKAVRTDELDKLEKMKHIARIETSNGSTTIHYHPRAVQVGPKNRFNPWYWIKDKCTRSVLAENWPQVD